MTCGGRVSLWLLVVGCSLLSYCTHALCIRRLSLYSISRRVLPGSRGNVDSACGVGPVEVAGLLRVEFRLFNCCWGLDVFCFVGEC